MKHGTPRHVAVCGPEAAAPLLSAIANGLQARGIDIWTKTGAVRDAAKEGRWKEVEVLVTYGTACSAEEIASASRLRAIVVPSKGYEWIDVDAATQHRILVANGQVNENHETMAEAIVLLMLMLLYDIHAVERRLRNGEKRHGPLTARMLRGKTVGIIGFGNIGRSLAQRLQNWGVTILAYTRHPPSFDGMVDFVELDRLLAESDIVVPVLELNPETHHFLDRRRLRLIKEGGILINVSRGGIIDESALCEPDVIDRLGGIALDVFEKEPLPPESPLRRFPKTILTQHEVGHTQENFQGLLDMAVENVIAALEGRVPKTTLNGQIEAAWRQKLAQLP